MAILTPLDPAAPAAAPKARYSWGRLARLLALIYVSVAAYAWFFSEDKIFLPHPPEPNVDARGYFDLPVGDGTAVSALWLPHPLARKTLLYSHGNAEDLSDVRPMLEEYQRMGFSVLAYDYPGYGRSAGKPTEASAYRDILAAWTYLTTTRHVKPEDLIVVGHSLGGGPSSYLATQRPIGGLVLESTFTSAFRVLTHVPLLPFDRFDTASRMKDIHVPILVIHGRQDDTIPFWHGEALYAIAPSPKTSLWLDAGGHDDVVAVGGDRYARALRAFADSL